MDDPLDDLVRQCLQDLEEDEPNFVELHPLDYSTVYFVQEDEEDRRQELMWEMEEDARHALGIDP